MSFEITVTSQPDKGTLRAMDSKRVQVAILRGMKEIGKLLTLTARAGIRKRNKTGRVYNFRGRKHRAGAPGEYPAKRTGDLGRSIDFDAHKFRLEFGTNSPYAKFLQQFKTPEERTSQWKIIQPRPFLTLSHDANKDEFRKIMQKNILSEFNL